MKTYKMNLHEWDYPRKRMIKNVFLEIDDQLIFVDGMINEIYHSNKFFNKLENIKFNYNTLLFNGNGSIEFSAEDGWGHGPKVKISFQYDNYSLIKVIYRNNSNKIYKQYISIK